MPHKTYNTPKRKCVVKTRLTEDERKAFEDKCAVLSMSQSEYIRQAIFYSRIARYLNEYGAPYNALSGEVRAAVSDLAALKFEVLKVIGEAYGNDKAYQL